MRTYTLLALMFSCDLSRVESLLGTYLVEQVVVQGVSDQTRRHLNTLKELSKCRRPGALNLHLSP